MQSYAGNPERYAEMLDQFDRECLRTGAMLLAFARRNGASKLAGLAVKIVDAEKRCGNDGILERARTLGKYRLNATTTVDAKEAIKKVLVSAIEGMKG